MPLKSLKNLFYTVLNSNQSIYFARSLSSPSDQNSMSRFLFLAANALPQSRFSLIMARKNTSSNHDLRCKSCLKLVFLRSKIRERRHCGKALAAKNKKCDMEFWPYKEDKDLAKSLLFLEFEIVGKRLIKSCMVWRIVSDQEYSNSMT